MRRPIAIAALAALVVVGVVAPVAAPARAAATDPKVVVIVGATHGTTSKYRQWADVIAAEARKYTPNVVKVYSPYATWSAVKSALQGANVVAYLGHGNGFPSPYSSVLHPDRVDGFGLNAQAGQGDSNTKYYGESYIASEIKLAPSAVVILNHLCYASGNSEPGHAEPSVKVAHQRIDNYAAGFIRAGARAVVAEGHSGGESWIRTLFTTRQTMDQAFRGHPSSNDNVVTWGSSRNTGYTSYSDPGTPTTSFYRSMVGRPDLRTEDVTGGKWASTDVDPSDFVVPGAASVGDDGADLFAEPALDYVAPGAATGGSTPSASPAEPTDTLTADRRLRVVEEAASLPDGRRVLQVETLDGEAEGYVDADDLVPRDSLGPALGRVEGVVGRFSPNADGVEDRFRLAADVSETVDWTFRIRDDESRVVREVKGSGDRVDVSWDGRSGGATVPDGTYRWSIRGDDGWGNEPMWTTGDVIVDAYLVTGPKLTYTTLTPVRLLDTRVGNGLSGPFVSRTPRTVQIAGRGNIPGDATAVTVNLTITGSTSGGHVALTPVATASPTTSTINFPAGDTRANGVTVPLGPDGRLAAVFIGSGNATSHVILDVTGYFRAKTGGLRFVPLEPARVMDTRIGNGLSGAFVAGEPRKVDVAGRGGVPESATAVTVNLTVTGATMNGYVALTPVRTETPKVSTINFPAGDTRANGVTVPLGSDGKLAVIAVGRDGGTVHGILDVTGYFVPASGAPLVSVPPVRLLDTRVGNGLSGPFVSRTPRTVQIAGRGNIPGDATAVTVNLTITGSTSGGHVALTPVATASPTTSTINFPAGDTRANGVTVPLGPDGRLAAVFIGSGNATSHVILDVTGYFR